MRRCRLKSFFFSSGGYFYPWSGTTRVNLVEHLIRNICAKSLTILASGLEDVI